MTKLEQALDKVLRAYVARLNANRPKHQQVVLLKRR